TAPVATSQTRVPPRRTVAATVRPSGATAAHSYRSPGSSVTHKGTVGGGGGRVVPVAGLFRHKHGAGRGGRGPELQPADLDGGRAVRPSDRDEAPGRVEMHFRGGPDPA